MRNADPFLGARTFTKPLYVVSDVVGSLLLREQDYSIRSRVLSEKTSSWGEEGKWLWGEGEAPTTFLLPAFRGWEVLLGWKY